MTAPTSPTNNIPDPLQTIRDKLQLRESEAAKQADRLPRQQQLIERLAGRFKELLAFACSWLARDERSQGDTYCVDLAHHLLAFNETLRETDQECPRFRIVERLRRAARAGVPALDVAASLLLTDPSAPVEGLAHDLKRFQGTHPHDVWPMWLTYILDHLMNSHRPPIKDNVPPDTTRDEWRKAEIAFGCILFSDDSFRVAQQSVDHAACQIDYALKCGGYKVLVRPPGRVRDLIARFDSRALHWFGSESLPLVLLQPPPSIEAITEPESLRRQLDEVWTAANCLQIALDKWAAWFVELQEKNDAEPGIALNCGEMARRAVKVLLTHRPNLKPFDSASEDDLLAMFPPLPDWREPGADDGLDDIGEGMASRPSVRWQEDRRFLDRYYRIPERLQDKAAKLRAAAAQLIDLLRSFPMTAVASARPPVMAEESVPPQEAIEVASPAPTPGDPGASGTTAQEHLARTTVAPVEACIAWTTADLPSQWAKLFGISVATWKRRIKDGRIRHKKLSSKSYQIAIADLPAKHQAKFRNSENQPPK